jgi:hypothetical protein
MEIRINKSSLPIYFLALQFFFLSCVNTFVNAIAASPASVKSSTHLNQTKLYNITDRIEELIPADRITVDLMQLLPPARLVELSQKFKTALQKNSDREWLSTLIKNTPTGQSLPYDTRFGVSQTEYQEFLNLSKQLTMRKVGTSILKVKREGKKFVFAGSDPLANLTGIQLDLDRQLLETPYGTATELIEVVADADRQRLTGTWNGVMWKLEQFDRHNSFHIKMQFGLGKLTQTGRGILYYEVTKISERAVAKTTPLVLEYDLPQSR